MKPADATADRAAAAVWPAVILQTVRMWVLLVEDDLRLAEVMQRGLVEAGHQVDIEHTGPDGLHAATTRPVDVIVLDWMLPGRDGPSVSAALRARGLATPILMLTAKHAVQDRIQGLDAGSDDYLAKPFDFDEFLARLRALSRRRGGAGSALTVTDLRLDGDRRQVSRAGVDIPLTAREFDVLWLLAERPGHVVSRQTILDEVWDGETDLRSNVIDVYIATLRSKIDKPFARTTIHTVRGVGYRLSDEGT
jgi:two-component system OmpR family response regulator